MINTGAPTRSDILPVELEVLGETKEWIMRVENNYQSLLDTKRLTEFYGAHVTRFRLEKKTPVTLEEYIANAKDWINRYIELFHGESEEIRTGILPPWPEQKKLIHEKRGILLVYEDVINTAGNISTISSAEVVMRSKQSIASTLNTDA